MMLPTAWADWVTENLDRKVDKRCLFRTLLDNGFSAQLARDALGVAAERPFLAKRDNDVYQRIASAPFSRSHDWLSLSERAPLYCQPECLTVHQCQQLIEAVGNDLHPSGLASECDDQWFRTSSTADLRVARHSPLQSIHQAMLSLVGLPHSWCKPMQVQRYRVGQQFKAHTDYFDPGTEEYLQHARRRGQRSWTLMVYLNTVAAGGETVFPRLSQRVTPQQGVALLWCNLDSVGNPNSLMLHEARPVLEGEKYVLTLWCRDRPYK